MAKFPESSNDSGTESGFVPGTRNAAFSLSIPQDLPIPILIAVPHAGRTYPPTLLRRMRRADYSTLRLEDRFVDWLAIEVARSTGAALLVANAPRAMLDLNRATDDIDWEMVEGDRPANSRHSLANRRARSGLGLVPRRLPGVGEIWTERLSKVELDQRIEQVHAPYHSALAHSLEHICDKWGAALLLDFHSMPPLKKTHRDDVPAQFVIGDRFGASANDRIVAGGLNFLADNAARVAHNRPYAGGYVLDRHAEPSRGIHAIQLEICRSLYLDAAFDKPKPPNPGLNALLAGLVRRLAEDVANLPRRLSLPEAAE